MHHAIFLFICGLWGTSFLFMKIGLASFSPVGVAAFRTVTGAAALAVIWRWRRRRWPLRRDDLGPLLFVSLVGYALPFWVQPHVIGVVETHSRHGSSFVGMMVGLVPLTTILASAPLLRVYPTPRQLIGVIGGLACMILLFWGELRHGVALGDLLLASITPAAYGLCNSYVKRRFAGVSQNAVVLVTLALSALMLLPVAMTEPAHNTTPATLAWSIAALVFLGVVCTGVAGFAFYHLIQMQGPLFAGMVAYVIPTVALLVGALAGERITLTQVAAMAGIFVMVALVQTDRRSV